MARTDESSDPRSFPHVDLKGTAMLLQRGGAVGRFTVQNLSAGGALLTGAHDVRSSAPLRVVLELPSGEAVTVGAHVRRRAVAGNMVALAVAFRHLNASSADRIQNAMLDLIDKMHRVTHPAVLIVDPVFDARRRLVAHIRELGRRALGVEAPLSALRVLEDPEEHVDTLLVREDADGGRELLQFVAESYPGVRPLLYVEDPTHDPMVAHGVMRCGPEHLREVLAELPHVM